jgi:hypothetical protein
LILSLSDDPWITEHSPIDAEKLHALGYLTFVWNACESWSHFVFAAVAGVKADVALAMSHDMGDQALFEKMKALAKARKLDNEIIKCIDDLKEIYDLCRKNRNQLSHFGVLYGEKTFRLTRRKGSTLDRQPIDDDLASIRRVGEECDALHSYLIKVLFFIQRRVGGEPTPLPNRPPLPKLIWSPPPQTLPKRLRQPRSSQE